MRRSMEDNSNPGRAVYDPFCRSGTTIIAAEMSERACHVIEVSLAYVDVAVTRWQNFTGKAATLEASGQAFADFLAERGSAEPIEGRRQTQSAAFLTAAKEDQSVSKRACRRGGSRRALDRARDWIRPARLRVAPARTDALALKHEGRPMGRPPHKPTVETRRMIGHRAAVGTPHEQTANLLKLAPNTMTKHCREEPDLDFAWPDAVIASTFFCQAKVSNVTVMVL